MKEVKTIILKDVLPFVDPVARSHARRVLKDAEGYKELVIDFRGIEFMGRGFADEVFRVFREEHPEITITPLQCKYIHAGNDSSYWRKQQ
ncbi:MAG: STAS-like domain-containing protein [Mediterraneibacter faecis]